MLSHASSGEGYGWSHRLEKLKTADHERVEQLVAKMERTVRKAFLAFVESVQSSAIMRQVAQLLGSNDLEGALRIVDQYVTRMAPVMSQVFIQSATAETEDLEDQVKRVAPLAGISFDPTHPRAAELMRQNRLAFIRQFTESQRQAVREALSQSLIDGTNPIAAAREFRAAIGLTRDQVKAVRNYRRLLTVGSSEALDRDLRDRRHDPTVRRAITTGEPLSSKQVDAMVERYRQRYLIYRSETIARTETGGVVSAAREEALLQVKEDADIDDDLIERTWRSTKDKRTRDSHGPMDGQTVHGTGKPFVSGAGVPLMRPHDPKAPASERINCRCLQTIRIRRRTTSTAPQQTIIDTAALDRDSRDFVLSVGRANGMENLDGYDLRTGRRITQIRSDQANYVSFSPELMQQLENPRSRLVLHHNHPSSSSLSGQDLLMLNHYPGMAKVFAHGHDGSTYAATDARDITRPLLDNVGALARVRMTKLVQARAIEFNDALIMHTHVVNLVMHRMGRINYSFELQDANRSAYIRLRDLIDQMVEAIAKELQ